MATDITGKLICELNLRGRATEGGSANITATYTFFVEYTSNGITKKVTVLPTKSQYFMGTLTDTCKLLDKDGNEGIKFYVNTTDSSTGSLISYQVEEEGLNFEFGGWFDMQADIDGYSSNLVLSEYDLTINGTRLTYEINVTYDWNKEDVTEWYDADDRTYEGDVDGSFSLSGTGSKGQIFSLDAQSVKTTVDNTVVTGSLPYVSARIYDSGSTKNCVSSTNNFSMIYTGESTNYEYKLEGDFSLSGTVGTPIINPGNIKVTRASKVCNINGNHNWKDSGTEYDLTGGFSTVGSCARGSNVTLTVAKTTPTINGYTMTADSVPSSITVYVSNDKIVTSSPLRFVYSAEDDDYYYQLTGNYQLIGTASSHQFTGSAAVNATAKVYTIDADYSWSEADDKLTGGFSVHKENLTKGTHTLPLNVTGCSINGYSMTADSVPTSIDVTINNDRSVDSSAISFTYTGEDENNYYTLTGTNFKITGTTAVHDFSGNVNLSTTPKIVSYLISGEYDWSSAYSSLAGNFEFSGNCDAPGTAVIPVTSTNVSYDGVSLSSTSKPTTINVSIDNNNNVSGSLSFSYDGSDDDYDYDVSGDFTLTGTATNHSLTPVVNASKTPKIKEIDATYTLSDDEFSVGGSVRLTGRGYKGETFAGNVTNPQAITVEGVSMTGTTSSSQITIADNNSVSCTQIDLNYTGINDEGITYNLTGYCALSGSAGIGNHILDGYVNIEAIIPEASVYHMGWSEEKNINTTGGLGSENKTSVVRLLDSVLYGDDDEVVIDMSEEEGPTNTIGDATYIKSDKFANHGLLSYTALASVSSDFSGLTNGGNMFYGCEYLTDFGFSHRQLSMDNMTEATNMFKGCHNLTGFYCDMPQLVDAKDMFKDAFGTLTVVESNLRSMEDGTEMFKDFPSLIAFEGNLSSLKTGDYMFQRCTSLSTFDADVSSLETGQYMFPKTMIQTWNRDMPNLTNGNTMFFNCTALGEFRSDLSSLEIGKYMFDSCESLDSFENNLSNLTDGYQMFCRSGVRTFSTPSLTSLKNAEGMFRAAEESTHPLTTFTVEDKDMNAVTTGKHMFQGCSSLKSFDANMQSLVIGTAMFQKCSNLSTFTSDDLVSLTDGDLMFNDCWSLTEFYNNLPVLTNGTEMFRGCYGLTSFDAALSSLGSGSKMFNDCWSLTTFYSDLSSLTDGTEMFRGCYSLTSFDADLPALTTSTNMFAHCYELLSFYSDLSSLTNGQNMFDNCTKLEIFDSSLKSLTSGNSMFEDCSSLYKFVSDLGSLTDGSSMFTSCAALSYFDADMPKLTNGKTMFNNCERLNLFYGSMSSLSDGENMFENKGDLTYVTTNLPALTTGQGMFQNCGALSSFYTDSLAMLSNGQQMFERCTSLNDFEFDMPSLTNGTRMFYHCTALTHFYSAVSSLIDGTEMFRGCSDLYEILERNSMGSLQTGIEMFRDCTSLTTFYTNLSSLTNGNSMFESCTSLNGFEPSMKNLTNGTRMFYDCVKMSYFYSDLSSLTTGTNMFTSCYALTAFDKEMPVLTNGTQMFMYCNSLQSFDSNTTALTNGTQMFLDCSSLQSFYSNTAALTNGTEMFCGCTHLVTFDADLNNLVTGTWMFKDCSSLPMFYETLLSLKDAQYMFQSCNALTGFYSELSVLTNGQQMFEGCTSLKTFDADMPKLTNALGMFTSCTNLNAFYSDMSSLVECKELFKPAQSSLQKVEINVKSMTDGTEMFKDFSKLDDIIINAESLQNGTKMFYGCTGLKNWNSYNNLSSLTNATDMFSYSNVASFSGVNMSSIIVATRMFSKDAALTTFNCDLSNLVQSADAMAQVGATVQAGGHGYGVNGMFNECSSLRSFTGDLSNMVSGHNMFFNCGNLTSFNTTSLGSLLCAENMFYATKITSFNADVSNLKHGKGMFWGCTALTSFNSSLSSLTDGTNMFSNCALDAGSVIRILESIPATGGSLQLGVGVGAVETIKSYAGGYFELAVEGGYPNNGVGSFSYKGWNIGVWCGNYFAS